MYIFLIIHLCDYSSLSFQSLDIICFIFSKIKHSINNIFIIMVELLWRLNNKIQIFHKFFYFELIKKKRYFYYYFTAYNVYHRSIWHISRSISVTVPILLAFHHGIWLVICPFLSYYFLSFLRYYSFCFCKLILSVLILLYFFSFVFYNL
jgi:hypothetical protein